MAPNKKIEDIVRLAEHYKRYVDAYYRFIFVGRYTGIPRYVHRVRALIAELGWLPDRFWFTGSVPDDELAVYYRSASVYISMSEHEGFCVPLVESMACDLPILAYSCTAIPDTLGGAGVQFAPKDFEYTAELLGVLAFDDDVRAQVIQGQRHRLPHFQNDRIEQDLRWLVAQFT
jgi:glycosyltransferase involved in cell wall biosynthesis